MAFNVSADLAHVRAANWCGEKCYWVRKMYRSEAHIPEGPSIHRFLRVRPYKLFCGIPS